MIVISDVYNNARRMGPVNIRFDVMIDGPSLDQFGTVRELLN